MQGSQVTIRPPPIKSRKAWDPPAHPSLLWLGLVVHLALSPPSLLSVMYNSVYLNQRSFYTLYPVTLLCLLDPKWALGHSQAASHGPSWQPSPALSPSIAVREPYLLSCDFQTLLPGCSLHLLLHGVLGVGQELSQFPQCYLCSPMGNCSFPKL